MIGPEAYGELCSRIVTADERYGNFASTHEALGVCLEEWDEFNDAIRDNNLLSIRAEALDLAAALIRLHVQLASDEALRQRSSLDRYANCSVTAESR